MNRNQYDILLSKTSGAAGAITVDELSNRTPRTLIDGYTVERHNFHVYIGRDDSIHVLVYRSVSADPNTGANRYLILDHAGPGGRKIENNREFLPSKRAYPERCDFEFCQRLRDLDVRPSFTTFSERPTDEGADIYWELTVEEQGMLEGTPMNDAFKAHPLYAKHARTDGLPWESSQLVSRMLIQAAGDLGVPADTYCGIAIVAKDGASAVLERATQYLDNLTFADVRSSAFTSKVIAAAYGYGQYLQSDQPNLVNGRVTFRVNPEGMQFQKSQKLKRFDVTGIEGAQAVIGEADGMPFVAAQLNADTVHFEVLQFGDYERILAQWMRLFNLTPAGKKKAVKSKVPA